MKAGQIVFGIAGMVALFLAFRKKKPMAIADQAAPTDDQSGGGGGGYGAPLVPNTPMQDVVKKVNTTALPGTGSIIAPANKIASIVNVAPIPTIKPNLLNTTVIQTNAGAGTPHAGGTISSGSGAPSSTLHGFAGEDNSAFAQDDFE